MHDNQDDTAQLAQREKLEIAESERDKAILHAYTSLLTTGRAETNVGVETLSDHAEVFEDNQHEIECDFPTFVMEQLRENSFDDFKHDDVEPDFKEPWE